MTGLVNLHGKKGGFVKQEIFMAIIMLNLCSHIANEIVIRKSSVNVHGYKVNINMDIHI